MVTAFERAFDFAMEWEGGETITNDPRDPGGLTKWGVALRKHPELTADDIRALTREQASAIYRTDYWNAINADALPPGLALFAFDTAVNCGVKRTKAWLNGAGGDLQKLTVSRCVHYALLDSLDDTYAKGWYNRLIDCYETARGMTS
jgi:lysozyme family protein